jgi:two-component system sensor histidine kinase YesM
MLPISAITIVTINNIYQNNRNSMLEDGEQGYNQVVSYLDFRFENAYRAAMSISNDQSLRIIFSKDPFDMNNAQLMLDYQQLMEEINLISTYQDIENFMFYVNGSYFFSTGYRFQPLEQLQQTELYENAYSGPKGSRWTGITYDYEKDKQLPKEYLSTLKAFTSVDDYSKITAYIRLDIAKAEIEQMLSRSAIAEEQIVYLINDRGEVLCSSTGVVAAEDEVFLLKHAEGINQGYRENHFIEYTIHDKNYYAASSRLEQANCYVVTVIPKKEVLSYAINLLVRISAFILAIGVFSCIAFLTFVKSITHRIARLNAAFNDAEAGSLKELAIKEKDEIGMMTKSYNYMVKELSNLLEQQFKNGKKIVQLELIALQSQINPHFLYNTLDMINWMAQSGELDGVQTMVETLSEYYRLTLNQGKDIITIKDELLMCKMYGYIQHKRFSDKIKIEFDVQEEVLKYTIPKITLQPLIENAINHGIREKADGRGCVLIKGWVEEEHLLLTVSDDGVGMASIDDTERKGKGNHYGVKNIEARLCLYYGVDQALSYQSIPGVGTKVTIKITKLLPEDNKNSGMNMEV